MLPDWPDPTTIFALGPVPARLFAGAAGLVLLFAGSRAYRAAVVLPGLLLGAGAALAVGSALGLAPGPLAGVAIGAGLVGALVAHLLERLAVRIAGVVGALGAVPVLWPLATSGAAPWWVWPVAAVLGGLLAPFVWSAALVPVTAFIGAVVTLDAAGVALHPLVVGGVALVGVVAQVSGGGKRKKGDED